MHALNPNVRNIEQREEMQFSQGQSERPKTEETLRQLSARLLQSQHEERRRIAGELYDESG